MGHDADRICRCWSGDAALENAGKLATVRVEPEDALWIKPRRTRMP